jgi:hypothetical protein
MGPGTITLEEFHRYRDDPPPAANGADSPEAEIPEPEPPEPVAATTAPTRPPCAVCGQPLPSGKKRYCNSSCEEDALRAKKRDRRARERAALRALKSSPAPDIPSVSDAPGAATTADAMPAASTAPSVLELPQYPPTPTIVGVLAELLEIPGVAVDMIVGGVQLSVRRAL